MTRRFLLILLVAICAFVANAQESVATIKGATDWSKSGLTGMLDNMVAYQNMSDPSMTVIAIAIKDGHFDLEENTLGQYLVGSGTTLLEDKKLAEFTVGGQKYSDVSYVKRLARMSGKPIYVEIWTLEKGNVEYTILALTPVAKSSVMATLVRDNLQLLPPVEVTEESFIAMVKSVNDSMQKAGGAVMSDEIVMTSASVDSAKKEFVRTYKIVVDASPEVLAEATSRDATYDMVEYEAKNTPLVMNAVEYGYTLVVVWYDKNGKMLSIHKFDFSK